MTTTTHFQIIKETGDKNEASFIARLSPRLRRIHVKTKTPGVVMTKMGYTYIGNNAQRQKVESIEHELYYGA